MLDEFEALAQAVTMAAEQCTASCQTCDIGELKTPDEIISLLRRSAKRCDMDKDKAAWDLIGRELDKCANRLEELLIVKGYLSASHVRE